MTDFRKRQKKAIQKNSGLALSRRIGGEVFDVQTMILRKKAIADPKRNLIILSEAEKEKSFARIFKPFHDEWIKTHQDGQKKYDALMKILADIRKGQ